jgi:hypothetical protein
MDVNSDAKLVKDKLGKLKELNLEKYPDIPDNYVDLLYKSIVKKTNVKPIVQSVPVDKTTAEYKVTLEFVNKILKNMKKDPIDDLTKFVDIDRLDIIKSQNLIVLENMKKTIAKAFDLKACGYYRKTESRVLNCLRGMIKTVGLKLVFSKRDITNDDGFRRTHCFYTIM